MIMKPRQLFLMLLTLAGVGCSPTPQAEKQLGNDGKKTQVDRKAYLDSLSSEEMSDGLVFWASEKAFSTNAELLLLLDTLYRHVRTDSFPAEVRTEELWMCDYRERLCSYYDRHLLGDGGITKNAKADSVLNEGVRLLELDCMLSTMEMIVNNSSELTFDRCREYMLLNQLISNCKSEEAKELVYIEWSLYEKMREKMVIISSHIVSLNYWGGSITGPIQTANYLCISESRRYMYQTTLNIAFGDSWDGTGVYLNNAEQLIFECCAEAMNKVLSQKPYFREDEKEARQMYDEEVKEAETAIRELQPLVDEWIVLMDEFDYEFTSDGARHSVERAASFMLIKWASIVSDLL